MQSLEARTKYANSFDCAYQIFKHEGVSRFWKGTTPRLVRLSLSGGIVFTVYENGMYYFHLEFGENAPDTHSPSTAVFDDITRSDQIAWGDINLGYYLDHNRYL